MSDPGVAGLEVTDPAVLQQLNAPEQRPPVSDPDLLKQLDGPPEQPGLFDRMSRAAGSMVNSMLAGMQGTSPAGNYKKLGSMDQYDFGPGFKDEAGAVYKVDRAHHIVLLDTESGKPIVYERDPKEATGLATSAGHVLAGGLIAPSSIAPAAAAATAASRVADADKVGITPNLPLALQNRGVSQIANTLKEVPLIGQPITSGIQKNIAEASGASGRVAEGYGSAATPAEGGEALQQGYRQFKSGPQDAPALSLSEAQSQPTRAVGFSRKAEALYSAVPIAPTAPVQASNTVAALQGISGKFPSNPAFGATLQNPVFAKWQDLLTKGGGQLTWDETNEFRRFIGQQMRGSPGELGLGPDQWRALYGAVSQDQNAAAAAQGPAALMRYQMANRYYSAGLDRLNETMGFLKNVDNPEKAFYGLTRMASERGRSANIDGLQATMRSMPDEARGDVAAAVINRLGIPSKAQAGANEQNFSIGTWASNYADIADGAKDALFGAKGTGQRDTLEALSRTLNNIKNVERLGNPSGTAGKLLTGAALPYAWNNPLEGIVAAAGGSLTSAALMSPNLTRWLLQSQMMKSPQLMAAHVARLAPIVQAEPELAPFYQTLLQHGPAQPTPNSFDGPQP